MDIHKKNARCILVFCDFYWPGFCAGGPITTLKSTIGQLQEHYEFSVVTRNHDYQSYGVYECIRSDDWNATPYGNVYYAGKPFIDVRTLRRILEKSRPDIIYLNSLFSVPYSFLILLMIRFVLRLNTKVILCPRGELNTSALQYHSVKKRKFLTFFRLLGLHRYVYWQATNYYELEQIKKTFGITENVYMASNLTWGVAKEVENQGLVKEKYTMKLIFISRINDLKNLKLLLNVIGQNDWNMELGIGGPVDESEYWEDCQTLLSSLKENCKVHYLGEIPNSEILETIAKFHYLCLPTRGENFGQIIYEALSIGRPVVISNQTPWLDLREKKAGYDVDIGNTEGMQQSLEKIYQSDNDEWKSFCEGALKLATEYNKKSKEHALELFRHALNS